jgi:DNA repair protein RecO (recombination protein O)
MNHFSDQGIILSVRSHGENGAVVHVLSENNGKCGGYVNGAQSSSRLKSILQPGTVISFEWQSKSEGQLGRFDIELEQDISALILGDQKALLAVQSICRLKDMFLPEQERHDALFHGTCAFLDILKTDQWPAVYITWEMAFLKELGYGIDLSKCAVTGATKNLTHVSPKSGRAVCADQAEPYAHKLLEIPHFLRGEDFDESDITTGLKMTEYFLIHRLLQQSSFQALPEPRIMLAEKFQ